MILYNGVRFPLSFPCPANVRRLDLGCLPMIESMNANGILLDTAKLSSISSRLSLESERLDAEIESLVGSRINPESGDQVARLLFDELGLPPSKLTRKQLRYSVDDDVLSSLLAHHPVVKLIADHREAQKLKTTYADALPLLVSPDGRIRTTLKATTARTGRLASENPNCQNIPIRSEWGMEIRKAFVARPGWKLISCDLSQIEMRVAAHESEDPALALVFVDGLDIHTFTAVNLFQLDETGILRLVAGERAGTLNPADAYRLREFKLRHRLPAKTLGFAVLYGVTASGLQIQILAAGGPLIPLDECQRYIDRWFDLYAEVRFWMERQFQHARLHGMVWDFFGRFRLVPEVRSALRGVQNEGLRQAGNHPIQSAAQGILKLAMAEVHYEVLPRYGADALPVLQIHDELLFEAREEIAEDLAQEVKRVMSTVVPLLVPVESSSDVAETWGDLK